MFGYQGKILKVNLTTGEIIQEAFGEELAKTFLGGNGFAVKLVYDSIPIDVEPMAPENALAIAVGPLTDTPVWGTSRGHMAAISPQTGLLADSDFGGDFAVFMKRSGFDAVLLTGKSAKPVYLAITEESIQLHPAEDLWGRDTEDVIETLQEKYGRHSRCAAIGPAGEKGVVFANILCGGRRYGAAGRGGMGAVMGTKHLKAILVSGTKKTEIARRDELKAYLKEKYQILKENGAVLKKFGTPVLVKVINNKGMLCTHNNNKETFEYAEDISGERIKEKHWEKDTACFGCPVACGKNVKVSKGEYKGKSVKMPEYETIYAMGSMLDNRDVVSIFSGNHACDLMGMDSISMGVTLSFVAECMEKGIVTEKELGGKVDFADGDGMVELIKKTGKREGIGDLLALGSAKLADKFGKDSYKYLYAVKGLEIAGHSARALRMMSLSYPTSTRGGSHHDGRPKYVLPEVDSGFDVQPEYIEKSQYFTCVGDSLVLCRFVAERIIGSRLNEVGVDLVNMVTGWNIDLAELEKFGERIYNLERFINVRRGISRKDDVLPYRVMNEPIPDGPSKGRYCPRETLDKMLDEYYDRRGWSRDGIPTEEKLRELGL
jgi:aldehyde:ferredoxin oxidoreductase